ncbi:MULTISPECIES: holo-ACP synthase [Gemella]|uniref:holo-ACP synthase n=1 Tax=Gemella TaxID=1378 RepID=UPI0007682A06|nr:MULTISPECIES: holo-ACP synthase [Gemella]AME09122.1 4'-phosphopantetheinyl transferase [Gemella sp. oral taxon 928]AXI26694.1 holo-[acyl-carrier-protein] synthase [Gemella sp. ND 6198]
MIYGIGCDIVDIIRFEKYIDNEQRLNKLYTKKELEDFSKITNFRRKLEFLASRFAVKEATSKALGVGISKTFSFHDVEVLKDNFGKPYINYKDFITHVTISHTETTAIAFVVLEKEV